VRAAKERAKEYLRRGADFVWNATNVSRDMRTRCIDVLADYRARVRIVHLEAPFAELLRRGRDRGRIVPAEVVDRLVDKWDPPDPTEAHEVLHPNR
jgi:predicted kinase